MGPEIERKKVRTNLSILHRKKQVSAGDPCRSLNYPNGKRQEDRINRMLSYSNYHSFDQQLCQKISKGTGFSFTHQALVPGFGHTVHLDKKQDQWETGCRRWPLKNDLNRHRDQQRGDSLKPQLLPFFPLTERIKHLHCTGNKHINLPSSLWRTR